MSAAESPTDCSTQGVPKGSLDGVGVAAFGDFCESLVIPAKAGIQTGGRDHLSSVSGSTVTTILSGISLVNTRRGGRLCLVDHT